MCLPQQYDTELRDGVINAHLDKNIMEIQCDALAGHADAPGTEVSLVVSDIEKPLNEWQVGDLLVAGSEWGCSFREDRASQPVYLRIISLAESNAQPSTLDLVVARAGLQVFLLLLLAPFGGWLETSFNITNKKNNTHIHCSKSSPSWTFVCGQTLSVPSRPSMYQGQASRPTQRHILHPLRLSLL